MVWSDFWHNWMRVFISLSSNAQNLFIGDLNRAVGWEFVRALSFLQIQFLFLLRIISLKGNSDFLCFLTNYPLQTVCLSLRLILWCNISSFNSPRKKVPLTQKQWHFFRRDKTWSDVHQSVNHWFDSSDQSFVFKTWWILDQSFDFLLTVFRSELLLCIILSSLCS